MAIPLAKAKKTMSAVDACDPLLSFSEVKELCTEILRKKEVTRNGITYIFTLTDSGAIICIALAD